MNRNRKILFVFLAIGFVTAACALPFFSGTPNMTEGIETADSETTSTAMPEVTPPEPTAVSTSTETPLPDPEVSEEDPAAASGACYNSYFPVLPDITWHYRTETAGLPATDQYQTYEEITEESFIARQEIVGETTIFTEVSWYCSDEGLLTSAFAQVTLPIMPAEFDFETIEFSGVSIPPAEDWVVGHTWSGSWQMKGTGEIPNVGTTTSEIDVVQENRVAAVEAVSVPAGSYENAVRIDSTTTLEVVSTVAGTSSPVVTETFTMSGWYVEGVGLVKQVSDDYGFIMELQSRE